jgi:hypothetical protein
MKTPLLYGTLSALINALCMFGLFFAGFHDAPEKIGTAQGISAIIGVIGAVVCMALAMHTRRAELPADQPWTYGSAFGTGLLVGIFGALIGAVVFYVYAAIVNPHFIDVVVQSNIAKMEAKGMSQAQIDQAEPMMRRFSSPTLLCVFSLIGGTLFSAVEAAIVAIFYRNRAVALPPVETSGTVV